MAFVDILELILVCILFSVRLVVEEPKVHAVEEVTPVVKEDIVTNCTGIKSPLKSNVEQSNIVSSTDAGNISHNHHPAGCTCIVAQP